MSALLAGQASGLLAAERTATPFALPRDPSTPVVTMTFVDGRSADAVVVEELMIFADGRVTAAAEPGSRARVSAQLSPSEWLKIQRILFVDNDLLGCQTEPIEDSIAALRRQRQRPQPGPDAAMTVFTVQGDQMKHAVRCHALGLTATQLPDQPEVQRLFACQQCLQNVVHVVRAGGYEQIHRTLESVNTRLARQHPGCGRLSSADLHLVDRHPDGTRYLQFCRMPCPENALQNGGVDLPTDERFLMVSVYERPGQPLEISIVGDTTDP
ncbi:MAG: hypothetical protein KF861_13340 [Planctomycetaceae bacterium]|nr:hypothetical protein [Planctomycetaceae bacterium]